MPFQVSPGVNFSEIDLTTVTPAVSSTEGAIAGVFRWGPVDTRVLIDSEATLADRFGKPTNHNAETFFTAANFLSYGNKLYVTRAANTTANTNTAGVWNSVANTAAITNRVTFNVKNQDDFDTKLADGTFAADTDVLYIGKWPGLLGNSLKISVCDSANAYTSLISLTANASISANATLTNATIAVGSNTALVRFANAAGANLDITANAVATGVLAQLSVGDIISIGNTSVGRQLL